MPWTSLGGKRLFGCDTVISIFRLTILGESELLILLLTILKESLRERSFEIIYFIINMFKIKILLLLVFVLVSTLLTMFIYMVTSMLVTDIGDEMCWWRVWPFKMAHFVTKIDNLFTVASVINIGASVKLHHCHQHFIKIFLRSKHQQEHSNQIHWESAITNFENYNRGFKHPVYAVP